MLFDRFKWIVPCPFGEVSYDSRDKSIYLGDYADKQHEQDRAHRICGKYRMYKWELPFVVERKPSNYRNGRIREFSNTCVFYVVADTQTHEVGVINPLAVPNVESLFELLKND